MDRSGPKSHPTDQTSISLLDQLRLEDQQAWQRLLELYGPLVYHWARRCDLSDSDSADVMQDVFAAVLRSLESFQRDGDGHSFRGWLRTITRNKIRDHCRKQAKQATARGGTDADLHMREIPDALIEEALTSCAQSDSKQLFQRLLQMMRTDFEEHTWRAFLETSVHGRSSSVVAAELNMSAGAVRQAKYKVIRRLRAEFGDLIDFPSDR